MPKKKMFDEFEENEILEKTESKIENFVVEYDEKSETKKKAYKVILITKNDVIYEVSPSVGNSFTKNIWGDKLVPGDTIYLEE